MTRMGVVEDLRSQGSLGGGSAGLADTLGSSLSPSLKRPPIKGRKRGRAASPAGTSLMPCFIRPKHPSSDGGMPSEELVDIPFDPLGDLVRWMEDATAMLREPLIHSKAFPRRGPLGPTGSVAAVYGLDLKTYPVTAVKMASLEEVLEFMAGHYSCAFYLLTVDQHASGLTACASPAFFAALQKHRRKMARGAGGGVAWGSSRASVRGPVAPSRHTSVAGGGGGGMMGGLPPVAEAAPAGDDEELSSLGCEEGAEEEEEEEEEEEGAEGSGGLTHNEVVDFGMSVRHRLYACCCALEAAVRGEAPLELLAGWLLGDGGDNAPVLTPALWACLATVGRPQSSITTTTTTTIASAATHTIVQSSPNRIYPVYIKPWWILPHICASSPTPSFACITNVPISISPVAVPARAPKRWRWTACLATRWRAWSPLRGSLGWCRGGWAESRRA